MEIKSKREKETDQDQTNKKNQTRELTNLELTIGNSLPFP
jgi:hypothetical protein